MKFRLILFILISIVPFTVKGQLHTDSLSTDVIFYSNANMYVGSNYSDANKPSLYIDGSAKYVDSGTTANKIQITQLGITQLMGDFVDSIYVESPTALNKLFSDDSYDKSTNTGGVILFAGVNKRQRIYREVPASVNKYRGYNYINFPILRVDQNFDMLTDNMEKIGYVVVEPTSSISIEDLQLGSLSPMEQFVGGFTLDARYIPGTSEIQSPFALIKNINRGNLATSDGWCRVDLTLSDMTKEETYIPNYHSSMDPDDKKRRYLTGFTPPFEKMAADYMFFQVLFQPDKKDLTSNRGPILNPDYKLLGGRGYFIAQEVSKHDYEEIEQNPNNYGVRQEDRFAGDYQFSRKLLDYHYTDKGIKRSFSRYRTNSTDIAEYFNVDSVKISLEQGLNFIGNPFTAPLDLYPLIAPASTAPSDNYNDLVDYDAYKAKGFAKYKDPAIIKQVKTQYDAVNIQDNEGYVSVTKGKRAFTKYDMRGKYWRVKEGQIHYAEGGHGHYYYYSIGNYSGSLEGGTNSLSGDTIHFIPPMGMFCVQTVSAFDIYLMPPTEDVLRAGHVVAQKSTRKNTVVDELLLQVVDMDTKEEDRTCIVFRDQEMTDTKYSHIKTVKNFSDSIVSRSSFILPEGAVYTKSLDSIPLLTNPVSKDIKQIALFVTPSPTRVKNIKINPYRMESLQSIKNVWIEDRLNPGVYQELTEDGVEYVIEPSTLDPKVELKNRFVLYFNDLPGGGKVEDKNSFIVYYHGSTLNIKGLIDDDLGSKVDIYDIQGRKVASTTINHLSEPFTYFKPLAHGTYIVKITGKRNHTSKFISLQN